MHSLSHAEYRYDSAGSTWDGSAAVHDRVLREMTTLPRGARVLDAGCGNGYLAALLASRGYEYFGVDPSVSGIEVARASYPGVRFVCGDPVSGLSDLP